MNSNSPSNDQSDVRHRAEKTTSQPQHIADANPEQMKEVLAEAFKTISMVEQALSPVSQKDEYENLIQLSIAIIRSEQKASVSLLQRRLKLGYSNAVRIMDELENRGIVGPGKGAEPRNILM